MRLTISSISTSQILSLDVPPDISVDNLKSLIATEVPSIPAATQHLYHNGKLLADAARTLTGYGLKDDDMVIIHSRGPAAPSSSSSAAHSQQQAQQNQRQQQQQQQQQQQVGQYDSEMIRLQVLGNPQLLENLRQSNAELADAVNDTERFHVLFRDMERRKQEAERQKQREIQMLNEDPFNIEAQQKIEELIRQEQVMENLQSALEHHPEVTFGRVTMLYIPVEVNGIAVKAFVDSGAQATIMSPDCAQRCGIMRLVDSRFAGIARGVGTAKILGRVHSAPIKIGNLYLACSFTVMEGKDVDLLLGLDMLKRHQATIDLRNGQLVIQDEEVPFLGESDIPKGFDAEEEEPTVEGPAGSKVGGRTGAIVEPPIRDIPAATAAREASTAATQVASSASASAPQFSDEAIAQLENLGFTKQQAISALELTNGDIETAASLLFS